jgi:hypothetical protein
MYSTWLEQSMMLVQEGKFFKFRYIQIKIETDGIIQRGARVKAMAICTRHQYLHIYKVLVILT